jgi:acyl-CoA synthetase (AMP-forming)/AMP-acid ligase II
VVATAAELTASQRTALARPRLVLSAGAPVPIQLQEQVSALLPNAEVHTPYGMTEALPVTDVQLAQLRDAHGAGVCVGRPVAGVTVAISPVGPDGRASGPPRPVAGVMGEICVSARHVKDRYDRLWATERASSRDAGWHRTGDVGVLDDAGLLWVQGRLRDVITTPDGPLTPVPVELAIGQLPGIAAAAVVGVGPAGTAQPVAVVVPAAARRRRPLTDLRLADPETTGAVRAAAGVELAAVLSTSALPVDIRHNSKIDRQRVARAAARVLAGRSRLIRP